MVARALSATYMGTYALGLWLENTGTAPETGGTLTSETEPNDTMTTANDASTSWRQVQYFSRTAGTNASGDIDNFQFQFNAGDLVSVNIHGTSSPNWRPRVALLNSNGTVVALEDGTSTGPTVDSPIYAFIVPTSGVYYVQVQAASGSGAYNADVYLSTAVPIPPQSNEADYYNVTLAAGDTVNVGLKLFAMGSVHVALQDPATGNWISGTAGSSNWNEAIRDYVAPSDGAYILKITGETITNYSLVVTQNAALDLEPNTLALPQDISATRTILGAVPDDDYYSFSVDAGERLVISTATPSGGLNEFVNNLDAKIYLYDNSGTELASDDNSAPDLCNAMLAYTFTDAGSYKVRVSAADGTSGEYVLSIVTLEPQDVRFILTDIPTAGLIQSTLPSQAELDIVEDHPFYGEIWVRSNASNPINIGGGAVTVNFNPAYGKILSIEPVNANWTDSGKGIIDNAAGTLTGLTRQAVAPWLGDDEWVLFARVQISGKAPVDEVGHMFGPYDMNLVVAEANFTEMGITQPASVVADTAKSFAVIYDVDDNGRIISGDFGLFSAAYRGIVGSPEDPVTGPFYTWADFDGSGKVTSGDLGFFSGSYRKYTSEIDFYNMPERYRSPAGPIGVRPNDDTRVYAVRIPISASTESAVTSESPAAVVVVSNAPAQASCVAITTSLPPVVPTAAVSTYITSTLQTPATVEYVLPAVSGSEETIPQVATALPQRIPQANIPVASSAIAVNTLSALAVNTVASPREAAVDRMFNNPVLQPKKSSVEYTVDKPIVSNQAQRLALHDEVLKNTAVAFLSGSPQVAENNTSTYADESNLVNRALNFDFNVVEVLAKAQLRRRPGIFSK